MRLKKIIIFYIVFFSSYAYAQNPIVIDDSLRSLQFGTMTEYLEDKKGSLNIDAVATDKNTWKKISNNSTSFGFSQSAYWFRFVIDNNQVKSNVWYLEINYPMIDFIDIYQDDGKGGWILHRGGDHYPFDKRDIKHRNFIFKIQRIPGRSRFFLRIKTTSSINYSPSAWSPEQYTDRLNSELPAIWIYYGVMMIMVLYNLFLFLSIKAMKYLYFSLSIFFFILFALTLNGYSFQYLWPNSIWWANNSLPFFICLALEFVYIFIYNHVELKKNFPTIGKIVFYGILLPVAVWAILSLIVSYKIGIIGATLLAIVTPVAIYLIVIYAMLKKNRAATFIVTGYSILVLAMVLYVLKTFGILKPTFLTNWGIHLGSALVVLLASLSLADEIKSAKNQLQESGTGSAKEKYARSKLKNLDVDEVLEKLDEALTIQQVFLESDLTLQKLAEAINITAQQLSEIINIHYKKNFPDFINSYRIKEAKKKFLADPSLPVVKVVYRTGFNSPSVFYEAFKKETGMSPGKFKKNSKK